MSALTDTKQAPIGALRQQRLTLHFDSLPVQIRGELLIAGFELVHRWPTLMAEAFGLSDLRRSDVLRDFSHRPAWYEEFMVRRPHIR